MGNKWYELILVIIVFLIPYTILGEELASIILAILGIIYLIIKRKDEIETNKKYLLCISGLVITGIVSLLFSVNLIKSLSGLTVYINGLIYYLIFVKCKSEKQHIIKWSTTTLAVLSVFYIIYQGEIFNVRIYGNVGYANTYSLLMLAGLYLNEVNREDRLYRSIQYTLMLAIIYTGSRNTLLFLVVFLLLNTIDDYKNREAFNSIYYFTLAAFSYVLFKCTGIAAILILPVIIYFAYTLYKTLSVKKKNVLISLLIFMCILSSFFIKSNTIERIKNISYTSGVFQERLVYYEDVLKHIKSNPFGSSINSYEYKQYDNASVFYDVKYIHNSFLQAAYDMGIQGFVFFIALFIYGLFVIYKNKDKNRKYYFMLYATLFLHSLMDFDFSYASIFIIASMVIAFSGDVSCNKIILSKGFKLSANSLLLIVVGYLFVVNMNYVIASKYMIGNKYSEARTFININKYVINKDSEFYYNLAQTYKLEYDNTQQESSLQKCLYNLQKAEELNNEDTRIIWNMAYVYEKLKIYDKAIDYNEKLLNSEKYYYKMYQSYYSFLKDRYNDTKNNFYDEKCEQLKQCYYNNVKTLNPRAKYMNNQLKDNFEDMLKMK